MTAPDTIASFEARCRELAIEFPTLPVTAARIVPAVQVDRLVFASGQTPHRNGKIVHPGKLGREVSIEQGQEAARVAALNCLTQVRDLLGSLDRIERIVRVTGYVASGEGFIDQALVVNGASAWLEDIFGEAGRHARAALGVAELPGGAAVEVDMVVAVKAEG